jgi:hypothetical protein
MKLSKKGLEKLWVSQKKIISVLFVLLLFLSSAFALEVREGDKIKVEDELNENLFAAGGEVSVDAPVNGDVMAFGGKVSLNYPVTGDAHACGGDVSVNGVVEGDLMSGGGNVNVNGAVNDDARIMGGNVNVNGAVAGDFLAMGGNINVNGAVGGDMSITGGNIALNGNIAGDVELEGGTVTISGVIEGNVEIEADSIELKDGALIKGNLDYSARDVDLKEEQVEGAISKKVMKKKATAVYFVGKTGKKVFSGLSILLVGIILVLIMPGISNKLSNNIKEQPWKILLYGLLALILTPIAAVLLAITLIGIPIAIILLILYALALFVSAIFAALYAGKLALDNLKKPYKNLVLPMLVGGLIFIVLVNIPFIGALAKLAAVLLGLGAITSAIFVKKKAAKKAKKK